jgi:hypothetical protein
LLKLGFQSFRDRTRILLFTGRLLDQFRKLERDRECEVAKLRFWRDLGGDLGQVNIEKCFCSLAEPSLAMRFEFRSGSFCFGFHEGTKTEIIRFIAFDSQSSADRNGQRVRRRTPHIIDANRLVAESSIT